MYWNYRIIEIIRNNIEKFIVKKSLNRLSLFLDGYNIGFDCANKSDILTHQWTEKEIKLSEIEEDEYDEYDEFVTFIENKLDRDFRTISRSLFNHLDNYYENEEASFDHFLKFYDEFLDENKEILEIKIAKYQKEYNGLIGKTENERLLENFRKLLTSMQKRVYMYVGMDSNLSHLKIYFKGLIFSMNELSQTGALLNHNFDKFIRDKFNFVENKDFFDIIMSMYENEKESLHKFFEHLNEFEKVSRETLIIFNEK